MYVSIINNSKKKNTKVRKIFYVTFLIGFDFNSDRAPNGIQVNIRFYENGSTSFVSVCTSGSVGDPFKNVINNKW